MNLLQPQFLYGLFALSIPIIVHLFNFRKAKKVYFPNTAFLQEVKQTSSAKRKLKHYLILLSRLLAIFFIVLAFAQPFLPSEEDGLQNSHVVIYLDNSQSMSNLTKQEIRGFDEAITYVNQLVSLYPKETQFLLLTNDFESFSNTFKTAEKIIDRTTELKLSSAVRSFEEVNKRITSSTFANNMRDYDVYWVSDFQKSTIGKLETNTSDSSITYNLLPIAFASNANLYIDSVYLDNPFDIEVNKSKVHVVVKNTGRQQISEAVLKLSLNDRQVSSKSIDLSPNASATVSFDVVYQFEAQNQAQFSLEDYPITFDDDFYFNLNAQQPLKIIEVRGQTDVLAIENVYANTSLFDYQLMTETNISYDQLQGADLIILNELTRLTPALSGQLHDYKRSGGKIAIIPSTSIDPINYTILAGTVISATTPTEDQSMISLQKPDLNHPFYANIFEKSNTTFSMPSVKKQLSWTRLNDLLTSNGGDAYLSYHEAQGICYIFASSLANTHTDLTQQAIFVPIMYKLASYKSTNSRALYHNLDNLNMRVELDSLVSEQVYKLKQGTRELIPSQLASGNDLLLEIPKNSINAGFAELTLNNQAQQVMAFNDPRQESNPTQWTSEELLSEASNNAQLTILSTTEAANFAAEMNARYSGIHLWKYAIGFALLFLFIEILIIRFYQPAKK
jgi:hypothetical protein